MVWIFAFTIYFSNTCPLHIFMHVKIKDTERLYFFDLSHVIAVEKILTAYLEHRLAILGYRSFLLLDPQS
jgi:hypothetical protein